MKYLKVFTDFLQDMEPLSFEERGRLFSAMLQYADNGTEPEMNGNERFLWGTAKKQIDAQRESYERQCKQNKINITSRYESLRNDTNRNESIRTNTKVYDSLQEQEQEQEQKKRKVFVPPTIDEVKAYCQERHNGINPVAFIEKYNGNGWMVGKNKMKDWKAAIRYWETFGERKPVSQYRNEDLERLEVKLDE